MERQYQKIEEEMPIPDENIKQQSSRAAVPNSKLNTTDYNNHKYVYFGVLYFKTYAVTYKLMQL